MDLVPAPGGENPVKTPLVEVESVDIAEQIRETAALEEASSEFESDSDDSEGWDALSHDGDTIQFLRDDQLRDGLGTFFRGRPAILPRAPPPYRNPPLNSDADNAVMTQFPVPAPWKKQSHIGSACMRSEKPHL